MLSFHSRRLIKALLTITSSALIISCEQKQELAFSRVYWLKEGDMEYPYRDMMLNDLIKNHQLKGLAYHQLLDSLGPSQLLSPGDSTVSYEILTEYGSDIDPIYNKRLEFMLGADSIVTSYKISEWKKD